MANNNFIIPPINSEGYFVFKEPYNKDEYQKNLFKVISIRSIQDILTNNEEPYESIYKPAGLKESDYKEDSINDVPIVCLKSKSGNFLYIPANRIMSLPLNMGIPYQEIVIAATLGFLPLSYDLDFIKNHIKEAIYESSGIITTIETIKTSEVKNVNDIESSKFLKLINNRRTVKKSWKTRYKELLVNYNNYIEEFKYLESSFIKYINKLYLDAKHISDTIEDKDKRDILLNKLYKEVTGLEEESVERPILITNEPIKVIRDEYIELNFFKKPDYTLNVVNDLKLGTFKKIEKNSNSLIYKAGLVAGVENVLITQNLNKNISDHLSINIEIVNRA